MSYNGKNYAEQGGDKWVIGGTLEIKEGATVTDGSVHPPVLLRYLHRATVCGAAGLVPRQRPGLTGRLDAFCIPIWICTNIQK